MLDKSQLERFFKGDLSTDELQVFKEYLQQDNLTDLEEMMEDTWNEMPLQDEIEVSTTKEIRKQIQQKLNKPVPVRRLLSFRTGLSVVAAIILMTMVVTVVWLQVASLKADPIVVYNEGNAVKKVQLADGSVVWLNQKTMLSYQFSRRKRLLELKGEAYFKVSRDVQRPFSIQTGNVSTTVLGTTFNVEAFPEDNRVEVSLVSGKVEVRIAGKGSTRSWSLSPGEQLQYLSQGEKVEKSVFNPQNETAWKGGQVVLVKTPLPTALHQISRFYNTALRFDTMNLKKCSVTSTFDQSNSIEEVLMVVLFSNNLTFKKHGNGYVIEGSGCDQ